MDFGWSWQLKYNIGCPVVRQYRTPKGAFRERRLRIAAAAKAQSKADLLAKRRNLNLENASVLAGVPGAPPSHGDLLPASQDSPATDLSPGTDFQLLSIFSFVEPFDFISRLLFFSCSSSIY